jgi:hypothetical protein
MKLKLSFNFILYSFPYYCQEIEKHSPLYHIGNDITCNKKRAEALNDGLPPIL